MPNSAQWVISWLAVARTGAVAVPLSTFYQTRELDWALRHNDIHTLLMVDAYMGHDYVARIQEAVADIDARRTVDLAVESHPMLRRIVVWGEAAPQWALRPSDLDACLGTPGGFSPAMLAATEAQIEPADDFLIICTSGSTAAPKAVVHTHGSAVRATRQFTPMLDLTADDRTLAAHAFFWISGLNVSLMPSLYIGAALCFSASAKPLEVVRAIRRLGVTRFLAHASQLPPVLACATPDDLKSLRRLHEGVADADGVARLRAFGRHMFGMTESFGPHSIEAASTAIPPDKADAIGRALPGVDRMIIDPVTEAPLPPGGVGELVIRGPTMMRGYYKKEWREVFMPDGYFRTGDLGQIDADGYFRSFGRGSEMIKTSGANVSPLEVEGVLARQHGIQEAIVFGAPDPTKGEVVIAVLVLAQDCDVDLDSLRAALKRELSSYKVPDRFVVLQHEQIPRTGSQKPNKIKLKELLDAKYRRSPA